MRKFWLISSIFVFAVVFSGCSLFPAAAPSKPAPTPTFQLSDSLWRSNDGGSSWVVKDKGEGKANAKDVDVVSLAINPFDGNNVYAGLRTGGILVTTDGGETWKFVENWTSEKVYGLALDPSSGRTLFASGVWQGRGKLFKTDDQGQNWKELYTSPANGPLIVSLTVDKHNPNVIYATTSDKEAIKSSDGGVTWKNIFIASSPILKLSIDSADGNLIYFITDGGQMFRSKDAGATFQEITQNVNLNSGAFAGQGFNVLETDPTNANWVYIAGEGGIALSKDAGGAWTRISALNNTKNFPVMILAIDPKNSNNMIYGADQAAYRSTDGGADWMPFQFDTKRVVRVLTYDPQDPNIIYLGFTK